MEKKLPETLATIGQEIRGGFVTFFAMAYIIALNPLILGGKEDGTGKELGSMAAIAATTPRGYRPNEQAEFTNGN